MTAFITATIIVAYVAAFAACFYMFLESNHKVFWGITLALVTIFGLAALIHIGMNEDAKGPCVKSEIQLHFNAATKTMMPADVCVLRGEWVK